MDFLINIHPLAGKGDIKNQKYKIINYSLTVVSNVLTKVLNEKYGWSALASYVL
jgi:hypothetical protein